MGLSSWIAGLLFFDILVILLISGFAASGDVVGTTSLNVTGTDINTTDDYSTGSVSSFISNFSFTLSNMPWWVNLFLITYNIGLIIMFGILIFRGVN